MSCIEINDKCIIKCKLKKKNISRHFPQILGCWSSQSIRKNCWSRFVTSRVVTKVHVSASCLSGRWRTQIACALQHGQHGQLAINHLYLEFYIYIYNMGNSINHVSTLFLFVSLCFTKGTSINWAPQLFCIFLSVFNAMGTLGKASIFFMISFLKVAGWSGVQNKIMAK